MIEVIPLWPAEPPPGRSRSTHGLTGKIHVCLRFCQDDPLALMIGFGHQGFRLQPGEIFPQARRDGIQEHEPHIVTVVAIFSARVA
jgi:hypothetical protein